MSPHSLLKDGVSAEDLKLFEAYWKKNLAVGTNLHSWMRIGLATNAALLAVVAFILRPAESGTMSWPLGVLESIAILIGEVSSCQIGGWNLLLRLSWVSEWS